MPGNRLIDLIDPAGKPFPNIPAILGEGRSALFYQDLFSAVEETIERLNSLGIGRGNPLALVLPDGTDLAVCLLAAACAAACVPLPSMLRREEFEALFSETSARAVILPAGSEGAARSAAWAAGLPVFELEAVRGAPGGVFHLRGTALQQTIKAGAGGEDHLAVILRTSGTTARPKLVPLIQANLAISARNVARSLELRPGDRSLNVMPLQLTHGLVASLLAPLASGGSAVFPSGFDPVRFWKWIEEFQPTWYTADPATHEAILGARVERSGAARKLRFVRSATSAISPQLAANLEKAFGAPLVEAYSLTEAAHQVTSTSIAASGRRSGTVGRPAGPEVAIMAENDSNLLPAGSLGEIVVRGGTVMQGYLANPQANRKAFTGTWFRTGDQGSLDSSGFLRVYGKLREIIRCGGEKISPREVDEALLTHPHVCQALTFSIPHPQFGAQVGCAVVLCAGSPEVSEEDLRHYAAARLTDYKVPSRILVLKELPGGRDYRELRGQMANLVGISSATETVEETPLVPPKTETERTLAAWWREVAERSDFGVLQTFNELGGDSADAGRLIVRYRQVYQVSFTLLDFYNFPTVRSQARLIEERIRDRIGGFMDPEFASGMDE